MSNLTPLNLISCEGITDEGLRELRRLSNLTFLNLSGADDDEFAGHPPGYVNFITDEGLNKELRHMSALSTLDLAR